MSANRESIHKALDRLLDLDQEILETSNYNLSDQQLQGAVQTLSSVLHFQRISDAIFCSTISGSGEAEAEISSSEIRTIAADNLEQGIPLNRFSSFIFATALRKLNSGEVDPFLMPEKNSQRKRAYTIRQLKKEAVLIAQFLHHQGLTKAKARAQVAEVFGESSGENIRKWEERLLQKEHQLPREIATFKQELQIAKKSYDQNIDEGEHVFFVTAETAIKYARRCAKEYRKALSNKPVQTPIRPHYVGSNLEHVQSPPVIGTF